MTDERQPTILVVDDDADFVAFVSTVLDGAGFRVITAYDGVEGLERARETPPDLVTLDIQMPRKTGVLFYRQFKADARLRSIPVVIVTGLRHANSYAAPFVDAFFEFNDPAIPKPDAFLDKPFDKESLLSVVRAKLAASEKPKQGSGVQPGPRHFRS